jgi:transcriptional regulator with XRE-family HTH domain
MNRQLKSRIILEFGTQEDFAKAVGERPSFISMVVRGRRELSEDRRRLWASALKCQPEDIFPDIVR